MYFECTHSNFDSKSVLESWRSNHFPLQFQHKRPGSERKNRENRLLMTMSLLDNDLAENDNAEAMTTSGNIMKDANALPPPLKPVRNAGIAWGACSSFDEDVYQNV